MDSHSERYVARLLDVSLAISEQTLEWVTNENQGYCGLPESGSRTVSGGSN